jgi:transcription elongation GreA/GreB family factor
LETDQERSWYFIAGRAGGTEVKLGKSEVLVITPQSPLGEQLLGKKQGERLQIVIAGARREHKLISVE